MPRWPVTREPPPAHQGRGPLTEGARIGVKDSGSSKGIFTTGYSERNNADPARFFFDNGGKKIVCKNGEACFGKEWESKEAEESKKAVSICVRGRFS